MAVTAQDCGDFHNTSVCNWRAEGPRQSVPSKPRHLIEALPLSRHCRRLALRRASVAVVAQCLLCALSRLGGKERRFPGLKAPIGPLGQLIDTGRPSQRAHQDSCAFRARRYLSNMPVSHGTSTTYHFAFGPDCGGAAAGNACRPNFRRRRPRWRIFLTSALLEIPWRPARCARLHPWSRADGFVMSPTMSVGLARAAVRCPTPAQREPSRV